MIKSLNQFFNHPLPFWVTLLFLAAFTFAASAMYPTYFFNKLSNYAFYIILFEFGTIFFFLIISNYRLMWFTLACTGLLSLHLKNASNKHLILPSRNAEVEIKVSLYHVNAMTDLTKDLITIKEDRADVLIFNEISPEWSSFLTSELDSCFQTIIDLPRIDPYGTQLFTNLSITRIDTLIYQDSLSEIPSISLLLTLTGGQTVGLTNIYNLPAINQSDYGVLAQRLAHIQAHLNRVEQVPWIFVADINMASWVNEIIQFTTDLDLQNSRRNSKLRRLPLDHIFFNNFFECYAFDEIENEGRYIGITGAYQVLREITASN